MDQSLQELVFIFAIAIMYSAIVNILISKISTKPENCSIFSEDKECILKLDEYRNKTYILSIGVYMLSIIFGIYISLKPKYFSIGLGMAAGSIVMLDNVTNWNNIKDVMKLIISGISLAIAAAGSYYMLY